MHFRVVTTCEASILVRWYVVEPEDKLQIFFFFSRLLISCMSEFLQLSKKEIGIFDFFTPP